MEMSAVKKIIPCLDVKNGRVVKGIRFVRLRDARDPVEAASAYCEQGADELCFLDIAAGVENRGTKIDWVKRVAAKVTIPFIVGGGIRSLEDMKALFDLGVDKVSINTAAVKNPDLIKASSEKFGKKKIVVAIDAKKNPEGSGRPRLEVVIRGGQEATGLEVIEWAKKVEALGPGEILLTSIDADGTEEGYDLELTSAVTQAVKIPVIASGGAGAVEHIYEVLTKGGASAALAASIFHFGKYTVKEVKEELKRKGVLVR